MRDEAGGSCPWLKIDPSTGLVTSIYFTNHTEESIMAMSFMHIAQQFRAESCRSTTLLNILRVRT